MVFAEASGLSKEDALNVLSNSPAYSRIMDAKGPKMVQGDFTPQARLSQHIKDVRLMLEEAARNGTTLPLSTRHLELLEQAEAAGLGELDNSAIIRVIKDQGHSMKVRISIGIIVFALAVASHIDWRRCAAGRADSR